MSASTTDERSVTVETAVTVDEESAVLAWRERRLLTLGFAEEDALVLAAAGHVDTHEAASLLARGCTHELAVRILL